MKHLIVIPAYNEEENLPDLLDSMVEQELHPDLLVVVDDGSADETARIVSSYASKHNWIRLKQNPKKDKRSTGSKIVKAFNLGLSDIDLSQFHIVSKFDADLRFPPNYMKVIKEKFEENKRLGLTGGHCIVLVDDEWKKEIVAKGDHIRGALKSYRVTAFEEIEGIPEMMGWDSADEFLLRFNGWDIKNIHNLEVKHKRETDHLNGWKLASKKNAQVYHNLRYGFFIGSISSLKRCLTSKPFILNGISTYLYFILGYFKSNPYKLNREVGHFIRKYRWNNMFKRSNYV